MKGAWFSFVNFYIYVTNFDFLLPKLPVDWVRRGVKEISKESRPGHLVSDVFFSEPVIS